MYSFLLTLKFILYTNLIKVQYNRISVILISSLISTLILSLIYKSKSKRKSKHAFTFYTVVSILMLVNATYFAHFNNLTSVNLIPQIPQLKTVGDNLKILLDIKKLLLIIDLPIMLVYSHIKKRRSLDKLGTTSTKDVTPSRRRHSIKDVIPTEVEEPPSRRRHSERSEESQRPQSPIQTNCESCTVNCELNSVILSKAKNLCFNPKVLVLALIILLTFYSVNGKIKSIATQELYTYHLLDIVNNVIIREVKVEADEVLTKGDIEELKSRANLADGKLTGIGKGKNLIVLQVEALQNFVVDLKYNGQEITPNINKFVHDNSSIYYNNYYQLLGRGNTSDAEFVSQNSLHPSMEEPTYIQYANNTFYGLPWLLRDNGYTSWVFHGYQKDYWNREEAYINQGFQRYLSEEDYTFDDIIGFGLKDEDFFDQSIEYLKKLDQIDENPFYAFMITLSSHTPFLMPEDYHVLDIEEEYKDTMLGNYLQAIHYVDKQIGIFIERLKEEGLYDDTVIALYGDHFAVHSTDETEQQIMSEFLGKNYDFDDMMNIPLVIHVPGENIKETNSKVGSQLDFYPTISNIMGYKNEKGLVFGRDLNNYKGENYVFPQTYMLKGSVITQDKLFVTARDGIFDHSRAYDLKTKKEVDINKFKTLSQKALEEINKSNYILKNDLLKE